MSGISRHFGNTGHFDDLSDSIALPTEPVRKTRQKGMTQKKLRERLPSSAMA